MGRGHSENIERLRELEVNGDVKWANREAKRSSDPDKNVSLNGRTHERTHTFSAGMHAWLTNERTNVLEQMIRVRSSSTETA